MSARQRPVSLSFASSRIVATDSWRARSMKAHVLTTRHSASSGRGATWWPAAASMPSISSESTWFFGQPRVVRWTFMREASLYAAIVRELERDAEVLLAEHGDDLLQVVPVLARDAHLVLLDGGLDLELGVLDHADDLSRLLDRDPLLERDLLAERAARHLFDLPVRQRRQRHAAFVEARLEDVHDGLELHVVDGGHHDVGLVEDDLVLRALEVVARLDLAPRLVERVGDLLHVDLARDVERVLGGHGGPPYLRGTV